MSCQEIGRKIFSTRHVVLQHTCNLYIFQHGSTVGQSIVGLRRFNSERIRLARYLRAVDISPCTGTQTDAALVLAAAVAHQIKVAQSGVSHRSCVEIVAVVVGFNQTVAGSIGLVSHKVGSRAAPTFCPVETIVRAIHYYAMVYIHRTAKELQTVIGTYVSLHIRHLGSGTHTVERNAVGLVFVIQSKTRIFQTYILQHTGIIIGIIAAISGITDFRKARTRIGGSITADVQTAPTTGSLIFGRHHDRIFYCAHCIDFGSLLDQDVNRIFAVGCRYLHTFFDGKYGGRLYLQLSGQFVLRIGRESHVFRHDAAQVFNTRSGRRCSSVLVVVTSRKHSHRSAQSHSPRGNFHEICFHLSLFLKF